MPSHMVETSQSSMCPLCGRLVRADAAVPAHAAPMRAEWRRHPAPKDSYFEIAMRVHPASRRSAASSALGF